MKRSIALTEFEYDMILEPGYELRCILNALFSHQFDNVSFLSPNVMSQMYS